MSKKMRHVEFGEVEATDSFCPGAMWTDYKYCSTPSGTPFFARSRDLKPIVTVEAGETYHFPGAGFVYVYSVGERIVNTGPMCQSLTDAFTNYSRYTWTIEQFEHATKVTGFDSNIMFIDDIGVWVKNYTRETAKFYQDRAKYIALDRTHRTFEGAKLEHLYRLRDVAKV